MIESHVSLEKVLPLVPYSDHLSFFAVLSVPHFVCLAMKGQPVVLATVPSAPCDHLILLDHNHHQQVDFVQHKKVYP